VITGTLGSIAAWGLEAWNRLGPSETVYPILVAAIFLLSLAFLLRPFITFLLLVGYLVIANNAAYVIDFRASAVVTGLLTANCLAGILLIRHRKLFDYRNYAVPALAFMAVAILSALYGIVRGNPLLFVLGDVYQIAEFALLFMLSAAVVTTAKRLEYLVAVFVLVTIFTSLLQTVDAFSQASYLPEMEGISTKRVINMYAPIAFPILLAVVPIVRVWPLVLTALAIVETFVILSFSRGLWLAAGMATLFLLLTSRGEIRGQLVKVSLAGGAFAVAIIFGFGLGPVIFHRVSYGVEQLRDVPRAKAPEVPGTEPPAVPGTEPSGVSAAESSAGAGANSRLSEVPYLHGDLASRRVLEHVLLLQKIAEKPFLGHGLGATYLIAGDAVLGGPKGRQISFHFIHDLYLAVPFRMGLPVLAFLLGALGLYFGKALRNIRLSLRPDNLTDRLSAGMVAAVFGQAVLSLSSPVLLTHPTGGMIGIIMAAAAMSFTGSAGASRRAD
jgi:hypothetical protein